MADTDKKDIDEFSGIETTGHEWNGIKELNNPLPNWWRWIFWGTVIWSIGYWIAYPSWPLISSYTKGVLGYSSRAELAEEVSEAQAAKAAYLEKIEEASLEEIRTDPELLEFALAGGRSAFSVNCSQCHGSGAQGFEGYPNLNDDEWIWGGTLQDIHYTITHGIRNETDPDARFNQMPAFLSDGILERDQVTDVVEYVRQISGQEHDAAAAQRGEEIFAEQCVACHGEGGAGMTDLGAPALDNDIWLYGGDRESLTETIANSRGGVMPAWGRILKRVTVKQLAVYVHSLGGGQ